VVLDGMTQKELEARAAESLKMFKSKSAAEVFPGITQQELEMLTRQNHESLPVWQTLPGATQDQVKAARTGNSSNPNFHNFPPSGKK
jgi:hypothetical protein